MSLNLTVHWPSQHNSLTKEDSASRPKDLAFEGLSAWICVSEAAILTGWIEWVSVWAELEFSPTQGSASEG